MKTKLTTLIVLIFWAISGMKAQTGTNVIGHDRGIYVDDFVVLNALDKNIDFSQCMLGNDK